MDPLTVFKSRSNPYMERISTLEAEIQELNRSLSVAIHGRLLEHEKKMHLMQLDIKALCESMVHYRSLVRLVLDSDLPQSRVLT